MGLVTYGRADGVATIALDDGKVNVMSPAMIAEINAALDRAESDRAVVLFAGRDGVLSAGFDLGIMRPSGGPGGQPAADLVVSGMRLALRMLSFPYPIVIACTGHAVAMGVFFLLAADYRVGPTGAYRLTANEVAIGMTVPYAAVEILRHRLAPAYFHRAAALAEPFCADDAVQAGFLDRVVPPQELHAVARAAAVSMTALDLPHHAATKLRARRPALEAIRAGIDADIAEFKARR